ncbi:MAG: FtsX-like permease family protein, partial [Bacteroidales bacterium]|nr:FtsX-like permease family protein [Bacteroidales bacterium]
KTTTIILLLVAILVVGIAFINYINFFFALVPERIRAVNTKKVLGSSRTALILSTLKESFWLILMALAVAAILVMLFNMTQLTHLISASTQFSDNVPVLLLTLLIAIVISLVASLYPAFYITSFEPAMVLKGSFAATTAGRRLRYVLIGLQFVISITLIVCSTFISLQRRYMINFDIGIDKEQLLYVHTSEYIGSNAEAVEEQLKTNPQITDVTWGAGNFLAFERMSWGREWKDRLINFQCYPVATNFVEFMGIEMTEGRSFLPQDKNCENGVFIFNESARRQFGMTLHDRIHGHAGQVEIVGFCDDFCFQSLKEEVSPFALYVFGADPWWHPSTIFIRVAANADYAQVMKHIGTVLSQWDAVNSPDEWQISFFDENLNDTYKKEQSLSQLIGIFTLIAIIISLMGVFGLVMFETQYRRKEIALRRVNGASVNEILAMFCSRFVKIVLVCFVLAAPLSWLIVNRYLSTFAHRCPMYWWVFVLALLAVLFVTILVVVLRSWHAATAHPAESLKTE